MTQVCSPWHARAFALRQAARGAALGVPGPKTAEGALRAFRVVAASQGLRVREASGVEIPIKLGWLINTIQPYLTHFPPWVVAKKFRDKVKCRRPGSPIVFSRKEIDFMALPRVAKEKPKMQKKPVVIQKPVPVPEPVENNAAPKVDWSEDWGTGWDKPQRGAKP